MHQQTASFWKSMAANMLAAYYSRESRAEELFSGFKISESPDFQKYANQYNTIFLNMQDFLSQSGNVTEMIALLQKSVLWELLGEYPDFDILTRPTWHGQCRMCISRRKYRM